MNMYCHKCWDKSPEGSAFCIKCGVKLISSDEKHNIDVESKNATISQVTEDLKTVSVVPTIQTNTQKTITPVQQKRPVTPQHRGAGNRRTTPAKSNKHIFSIVGIIIIATFAVIATTIFISYRNDSPNLVRMALATSPLAEAGLDATYGELFSWLMNNRSTNFEQQGDVAYLTFSGNTTGSDYPVSIVLRIVGLSPEAPNPRLEPYSMMLNGLTVPNFNNPRGILMDLFGAHQNRNDYRTFIDFIRWDNERGFGTFIDFVGSETPIISQPITPPALGTDSWITLTHEQFSVRVPASFQIREAFGGFDISDGNISMYVGYFDRLNDFWEWLTFGGHVDRFGVATRRNFIFDDGSHGFHVESDSLVVFLNNILFISINYDEYRSVFSDKEDLILAIARSLTSTQNDNITTQQPTELIEHVWVDVSIAGGYATISIPSTWTYSFVENGPFITFVTSGVGSDGSTLNIHVNDSTLADMRRHLDGATYSHFIFDDMHSGYMFEFPSIPDWNTGITWMHMDTGLLLTLIHDGNMSIFTNNEDLILRIAKSLMGN